MCDPMLLFAHVMGQATIIYLCKGMGSMSWPVDEREALAMELQQRALAAAEQIVNLSRALTEFHLFKASPSPVVILLASCSSRYYLVL